ncbi:MAG: hypothetical protein Q8N03_01250 [Ignavibacteria bacterium]|nr:hypothetical protein [Ignavibacteria bacterium]
MSIDQNLKMWVVTADMGYGHQRAVYPFKHLAEDEIITLGKNDFSTKQEKKQWKNILNAYETFSRASDVPLIGRNLLSIMDFILQIPSFYPKRSLSRTTYQVEYLRNKIEKGICEGLNKKISQKKLPFLTSFYAPAIFANMNYIDDIYCIICDVDVNRVWVPKTPKDNKINYLVPCEQTANRLKMYGINDDKIFITGFPLPLELVGDGLSILKSNLGKRLIRLDAKSKFINRHHKSVEHLLGNIYPQTVKNKAITISYVVGGAGAQKEIASDIVKSLKEKLVNGNVKLNLIAGIRPEVISYFEKLNDIIPSANIEVICGRNLDDYFSKFNNALHETDILWTKPSELVFYSALGIPIILTPEIGAQETQNKNWLIKINAGMEQLNPRYADEWLFDLLDDGILADMAWSGFLKGRKLGTQKIIDLVFNNTFEQSINPLEM